jgi:UPF0755 protein
MVNHQLMKKKSKKLLLKTTAAVVAMPIIVALYLFGIMAPRREIAEFNVASGASVSSVATKLKSEKLIVSETLFKAVVRVMGGNIQIGGYDIPAGSSVWRIGSMMSRGRVATIAVMIPEGFTIKQIEKMLGENELLTGSVSCALCPVYKDGEIFPDTYRAPRGTSRSVILELAKKKMDDVRNSFANVKLPPELKDWNDVMTLASIVQKETPLVAEMPMVAGVYINRLRVRMRLQADPTVVYAITNKLGDMQGRALLRSALQTKSPYNTYTNYGLPPAPIAASGRAAIDAVLHPATTENLYFVADGSGGHVFSKTYAEHQQRHNEWREIKKLTINNE